MPALRSATAARKVPLFGLVVLTALFFGPIAIARAAGLPWGNAIVAPHALTLNVLQQALGSWPALAQKVFAFAATAVWIALYLFTRARWVLGFAALYVLTQALLLASLFLVTPGS